MDFTNIDFQIELNQKNIEFYHGLSDKIQNKISFLVVIYTFIFVYIIELIKYPFTLKGGCEVYFYIFFLVVFLILLVASLVFTYKLINPEITLFNNNPKVFYSDVYDKYKNILQSESDETINLYIKHTYLRECERILEHNKNLYIRKSSYFYNNVVLLLLTLISYVLISSYVIIQKKNEKTQIEISNIKELLIPKT